MALTKLAKNGYGQLELNFAAFRRNGAIEAKCKMAENIEFLENGMLLAVDRKNNTVGYPTEDAEVIALNYTTEHMYDEREMGLKYFKLDKNTFCPRLGYIGVADKFTTNTVCYDNEVYTTEEAALAAAKYGVPCENGYIKLVAERPEKGFAVEVLEITTMPDGQKAVKFGGLN
jgi:hypothetical protein